MSHPRSSRRTTSSGEWGWRNEPTANFYLPFTRAWELLAGALGALIWRHGAPRPTDWPALIGLALGIRDLGGAIGQGFGPVSARHSQNLTAWVGKISLPLARLGGNRVGLRRLGHGSGDSLAIQPHLGQ